MMGLLSDANSKVKINHGGDYPALLCPSCGDNCLHSTAVTVFDRVEDADQTRETVIGDDISILSVPSSRSRNPSARRHGIAIYFWCEVCQANVELTFAQHKGATLVQWREVRP
jgi:hypothetical protein